MEKENGKFSINFKIFQNLKGGVLGRKAGSTLELLRYFLLIHVILIDIHSS